MNINCPCCGTDHAFKANVLVNTACRSCGHVFTRYVRKALRRLATLERAAKIEREFWKMKRVVLDKLDQKGIPRKKMYLAFTRDRLESCGTTRLAAMKALLLAVRSVKK